MNKKGIIGLVAGAVAGVAAVTAGIFATKKVVKEIKADLKDVELVSPEGNNKITLSCGASDFAKGLAMIKVFATTEDKEDDCKFSFLAGKRAESIKYDWADNDHFELTVGEGKIKQCCDVDFEGEEIIIYYYWMKDGVKVSEEEIIDEITEEAIEVAIEEAEETEAVETEAVETAVEEAAAADEENA